MINHSITDLIPQRPPFVMVDALAECNEQRAITRLTIRNTNIFVEHGFLLEVALMENMAQSCAVWVGYYNILHHQTVQIGVVGGLKDITIYRRPRVNEIIETTIEKKMDVFFNNMIVFSARTESKGVLVAEGELKVALLPDKINKHKYDAK